MYICMYKFMCIWVLFRCDDWREFKRKAQICQARGKNDCSARVKRKEEWVCACVCFKTFHTTVTSRGGRNDCIWLFQEEEWVSAFKHATQSFKRKEERVSAKRRKKNARVKRNGPRGRKEQPHTQRTRPLHRYNEKEETTNLQQKKLNQNTHSSYPEIKRNDWICHF